jgi:uncharacterized tellurite resistance protein B-like protein
MFESFRNFVAEFIEGDRHPSQFADNDYRLAAVALLVHAAAIDGDVSPSERDKLHSVVKRRFDLDDAAADELIDKATTGARGRRPLPLHQPAQPRARWSRAGRVIEMMWEIVYADGRRGELEDNLLWRAADLLGVSPRERIELRRRVGNQDEADGDE